MVLAADGASDSSPLAPFASLVQLAVASDDPARVVAAAERALGNPLGLTNAEGEDLGHAPDNEQGARALAVARTVACDGPGAPEGWRILRLTQSTTPLGVLAAGTNRVHDTSTGLLLELVAALLSDQLKRVALQRAQVADLIRRLTSEPRLSVQEAHREARELGLRLADAYWPGFLTWRQTLPPARTVAVVEQAVSRLDALALTVPFGDQLILLYPTNGELSPERWFREVGQAARRLAPTSRAQVLVADGPVPLSKLHGEVAELTELLQIGPRADDSRLVIGARQFALDRLLWRALAPAEARAFIEQQLGTLLAWDRQHRTSLVAVVEAALDFPRLDQAARQCFMHRNTFRHRLREATEVLGHDLGEADVRLAVHIALKLRRVIEGDGSVSRPSLSAAK